MFLRKVLAGATLVLASHSHAYWQEFTGTDQLAELVSAQDDRGQGKASPVCQYSRGDNTDYTEFHGLGYVVAVDDGSFKCQASVETSKILWENGNPWGTSYFQVLPKTAVSGIETRWTEFRADEFGRYIEGTFEDGIDAPICQVQHYLDEYENYANFHGLGFVKWDASNKAYRCFASKQNKIIWQPNGNQMSFSRFNVLKAAEPEVLSTRPSDVSGYWTFRGGLGKSVTGPVTINNSANNAKFEPNGSSFSVALWFYVDDLNGSKRLVRKGNNRSGDTGWSIFLEGNELYFRTRSSGWNADKVAYLSNPGWYHFTAVVDADKDRLFAYLNGSPTLVHNGDWSDRIAANGSINSDENLILADNFSGNTITDLRMFKRALSWAEAKTLAQMNALPEGSLQASPVSNSSYQLNTDTEINPQLVHWQFGNGSESFNDSPQVSYNEGGKYKLTMTLIDDKNKVYQQHVSVTPNLSLTDNPINSAVFRHKELGYACYRIPAITKGPNGSLLAFAEARTESCEDHHHKIDIVMKKSYDNGRTWEGFQIIAENGDYEMQNVTPVYDEIADRVVIVYSMRFGYTKNGGALSLNMMRYSDDGGETWSKARDITNYVAKPNRKIAYYTDDEGNYKYTHSDSFGSTATLGHSIQLKSGPNAGRLFFTGYYGKGGSNNYSFYSDDHGETWQIGDVMPSVLTGSGVRVTSGVKYNEAQSVELANGWIMANARDASDDGTQCRRVTLSRDSGDSWGETINECQLIEPHTPPAAVAETLDINQVRGIAASVLRFSKQGEQDINRILFSDPSGVDNRDNLQIKLSYDEGINWVLAKTLDAGGAAYSDMVLQDDQRVGVMYEKPSQILGWSTSEMEEIRYSHFNLDWMLGGNEDSPSMDYIAIPNDPVQELYSSALSFNGDNGWVRWHDERWNPGAESFTVAYRFKSNHALNDMKWHVEKSSRTDKWGRGWAFYQEDGAVKMRVRGDNGNSAITVSVPVTTSAKWHHVVGTINRSRDEVRLYVDGRMAKADISSLGDSITASGEKMGVGRHHETTNNQFSGKIQSIQVFDRALSSKSVRALTGDMDNQNWTH